ncbi:hypothetical protein [Streptomyces sp. Isolate_45]|nr:hypothetical protein [Streptomyces sp. Isolate_45]MDA5283688.1 hypothetical protein [Streptomyces sp. Isolate_45]
MEAGKRRAGKGRPAIQAAVEAAKAVAVLLETGNHPTRLAPEGGH